MTLEFYYHPISPPSRAVLILAEILKIKIEKKIVRLELQEHLKPEFAKINPNKSVPVLVDDGKVIKESRAILTYLVNKYSPNHELYPVDPYKRSQIDSALFFEACSIYGPYETIMTGIRVEKFLDNKFAIMSLKRNLEKLDSVLGNQKFVAGDEFSIADISNLLTFTTMEALNLFDLSTNKNIMEWKERVKPFIPNHEELIVNSCKLLAGFYDSLKK